MKRKVTIEYEWSDGTEANSIPRHHLLQLQSDAEDFIEQMRSKGYISGELHTEIRDNSETDPVSYHGWWSAVTEACNV